MNSNKLDSFEKALELLKEHLNKAAISFGYINVAKASMQYYGNKIPDKDMIPIARRMEQIVNNIEDLKMFIENSK
jgi:hypothetical protein